MSRTTLLAGAWIWMGLALAPLLIFLLMTVGPPGGVGVPLSPAGLNHALTHLAVSVGNKLASQIGGG